MKKDIYQEITDSILANVDDAGDWSPPWRGMNMHLPVNAHTGAAYRGVNILSLWMAGGSNEWASYKQWKKMGANVRKGERGTQVIFYKQVKSTDPEEDGYMLMRYSHVFNADQVDGYDAPSEPYKPTANERIQNCEEFVDLMKLHAEIQTNNEGRAFFRPSQDFVSMPKFDQFETAEHYYSVLAHELVHWTGHKSRLNREFAARGVDKATYAKEELVAEIGAHFVASILGIDTVTREDHMSYIKSWLGALRDDKRLIVRAASQASAACDYLMDLCSISETEEARAA